MHKQTCRSEQAQIFAFAGHIYLSIIFLSDSYLSIEKQKNYWTLWNLYWQINVFARDGLNVSNCKISYVQEHQLWLEAVSSYKYIACTAYKGASELTGCLCGRAPRSFWQSLRSSFRSIQVEVLQKFGSKVDDMIKVLLTETWNWAVLNQSIAIILFLLTPAYFRGVNLVYVVQCQICCEDKLNLFYCVLNCLRNIFCRYGSLF